MKRSLRSFRLVSLTIGLQMAVIYWLDRQKTTAGKAALNLSLQSLALDSEASNRHAAYAKRSPWATGRPEGGSK